MLTQRDGILTCLKLDSLSIDQMWMSRKISGKWCGNGEGLWRNKTICNTQLFVIPLGLARRLCTGGT